MSMCPNQVGGSADRAALGRTEVRKVTDFSRPKPCAGADFGIPYWRASSGIRRFPIGRNRLPAGPIAGNGNYCG
jgi:hypothetical protein